MKKSISLFTLLLLLQVASAFAASISVPSAICTGASTLLTIDTTGGTWSSSNPARASIDAGTGLVTGVTPGTVTISYNLIGATITRVISVQVSPTPIAGATAVCEGATAGLTNSLGSGTWSSATPAVATIGVTSGILTGLSAGTAIITFTRYTGCIATRVQTVNVRPTVISGGTSLCVGTSLTLTSTPSGGTWSSSTPSVATIGSATGIANALIGGSTIISYSMPTGCRRTQTLAATNLPAAIAGTLSACVGTTTTLTSSTSGGTWSSGNTTVATVGTGAGVVTGVASGTSVISYTMSTGCMRTAVVTVNGGSGAISGDPVVCVGSTTALSSFGGGGTWSSSNPANATVHITTGVVTGIGSGTTMISYQVGASCYAYVQVTINAALPPITGATGVCIGAGTTLSNATGGGTWSSSNTAVAVVGSSTGEVTGAASGTAIITYALSSGCRKTTTISVGAPPALIGGPASVCEGSTITLTNYTGGGTWTSGNTAVATMMPSSGVVTGVSPGTTIITYMVYTGCATTRTVTVNALPTTITGASAVCVSGSTALSSTPPGGTWTSSAPARATADPLSGVVTGVLPGTANISYTLPGGCRRIQMVTVNASPAAITGLLTTCVSSTTILSSTTGGGTWSSSNSSVAGVGTGAGVVTGVGTGTAIISYTLGTGCNRTVTVTVNAAVATISGEPLVCTGNTTTLSNATGGGTWSSSNTTNATVNMTTGTVTGVSAGTATISYRVGASCYSTLQVTVNNAVAPIAGTATLCAGGNTSLNHPVPGGTWSSSNIANATVDISTGVVTGISTGTAIITYTLSGGCWKTITVVVNAVPAAIGGTATVCEGSTTILTNTSGGGTWTSGTPSVATMIPSSGLVTGVSAGTSIVTYLLYTGCAATRVVTVNVTPTTISGGPTICAGSSHTLNSAPAGGTWTSSTPAVASIGSSTGIVTGLIGGGSTISYTLSTGCRRTLPLTVQVQPAALSGSLSVCMGTTTTLSSAPSGGTWSSSLPAIASISATGVVTSINPGTTIITYTAITGCTRTGTVTVNVAPEAGTIVGASNVEIGSTTTLISTAPGGTWSSSAPGIAGVSGTGVVSGISVGTATISYTVTSSCGADHAMFMMSVTMEDMPPITGGLSTCVAGTTTLSNAAPGGTWSSSAPAIGTISGSGVVTGISAGTTAITYTAGSLFATAIVTVSALPTVFTVTGGGVYCTGTSGSVVGLSGSQSGVNYQLYTGAATVGSVFAGTGSAISFGTHTVTGSYSVLATTAGTSCSTPMTGTVSISANPAPAAYTVTGGGLYCVGGAGHAIGLSNSEMGIEYQLYNGSAPVGTIFVGLGGSFSFGTQTATGTYTVLATNTSTMCTAAMTGSAFIGANPLPFAFAVTGGGEYCSGTSGTALGLSGSTSGVNYQLYSGTTMVGTAVSGTGAAISFGTHTATGTYTVLATNTSTMCTAAMTGSATISVTASPSAISGSTVVSVEGTTTLGSSPTGGTWSSSNTSVATVGSASGDVLGVSAGTAVISYMLGTGCFASVVVTVESLCPISGTLSVCPEGTTALSSSITGGTWTSANTTVATIGTSSGIVTGVSAGTSIVSYFSGTGCTSIAIVTVNSAPAAIGGPAIVCVGSTATQTTATGGGTWSSVSTGIATIGSASGIATGVSTGTSTISYILSGTGCYVTRTLTVNSTTGGDITGTLTVCVGATSALSSTVSGGTWSSSTTSKATVNATSGVVAGVSAGTSVITYAAGGCITTVIVSVNSNPASLTGTNTVNIGSTTTFSSSTSGGTWSSSNTAVGTVGTSGIITGISAGTSRITYTLATGCFVTRVVTVINPCAMTGSLVSCIGFSSTLSSPISGGTWTSANTTIATIGTSSGVLTGVTAGTTTISYVTGGGCTSVRIATVNSTPGAITGTATVCVGATRVLSSTPSGGTWSSSNTAIGTINSSTRTVTGISAGTVTMSYVLSASCVATLTMTVNPAAGPITGPMGACLGSTATLTNDSTGGTWSSSNTAITTIGSATGIANGVSVGSATVTYTMPEGCFATRAITTDTPIQANVTYGPLSVEVGKSIRLLNCDGYAALHPSSGLESYGWSTSNYWMSSNTAVASLSHTGATVYASLSGVSTGTVNVMYVATNGCGADTANKVVTVVAPVCPGVWDYVGGGNNAIRTHGYSSLIGGISLTLGRDGTPYFAHDGVYEYDNISVKKYSNGKFSQLGGLIPGEGPSLATDDSGYVYVVSTSGYYVSTVRKYNGHEWVQVGSTFTGLPHYSLIIDAIGDFYVAHLDEYDSIHVRKFNGTDWVELGNPGMTYYGADEHSGIRPAFGFVISEDGIPFVASQSLVTSRITVKKYLSGSWVTVGTTPDIEGYEIDPVSLTLDPNGKPHVPVYMTVGTYSSRVAKFVDSVCYEITPDTFYVDHKQAIAFDKNGILYMLYTDHSSKANVIKFDGSTWTTVGNPDFSLGLLGGQKTIQFDNNGTPYVAGIELMGPYYDKAAMAYKFDGTNWVPLVMDDGISVQGNSLSNSIVMSGDTAIIAYHDNVYNAVVKKYVDEKWENVGLPGISAGTAFHINLANGSGSDLFVVYSDGSVSERATVKKYNGSGWATVGSPGFSASSTGGVFNDFGNLKIKVDNDGTPYVSYKDAGNGNKATVMKYNGSSWTAVGGAGFTAAAVTGTSLDINSSGMPYLAYASGGFINVVKFNGSAWEFVGAAAFAAGLMPVLKLDNAGVPHLLYTSSDYGAGWKLRAMRFDGTNWVLLGGPDMVYTTVDQHNSYYVATSYSMSFNSSNIPFVGFLMRQAEIYGDESSNYICKYDGVDWVPVGRGFNEKAAVYAAIAHNSSETPYMIYTEKTDPPGVGGFWHEHQKAVVIKFQDNAIKGNLSCCPGYISYLSTIDTSMGTWSSGTTSVATINSYGKVTGISPGTSIITYDASGCIITAVVTVNEAPSAGTLSGTTTVAASSTVTFSSTVSGGTWSSGTTAVATVGSSSGIVTGVSAGTAVITYVVTNGCGLAIATRTVTVTGAKPANGMGDQSGLFSVYPNPTQGSLNIEANVNGTASLFTIDGKLIDEYKIDAPATSIALPRTMAAGVYMLRFKGDDGSSKVVRLVYE